MNEVMEVVREALGGRWEGESLKARCPVCGTEHLYVQPPDRDQFPTFACHKDCNWATELRPGLHAVGVPITALRGSVRTEIESSDREPLPSQARLERWSDLLLGRFDEFRAYLRHDVGLTPDQMRAEGLGARSVEGRNPRITVPVRSASGDLVGVRLWNPLLPKSTGKQKTWIPGHDGAQHLLGAHKLAGLPSDDVMLLVEGEPDYLAATAVNVPVMAVTAGAGSVPPHLNALAGRRVVVCFDNDDAGRAGARKQALALVAAGASAWIAEISELVPQDGGDLRDFLVRGGGSGERLSEWVAKVASGPVLTVEALATAADDEAVEAERRRRRVRRAVDAEEALADWQAPPSHQHMGEELDLSETAIAWTVENLHERGTNTLVVAGYKTGKTVLALNLLKRLVDNEDFLGAKTALADDGRRVAWWNYELTPDQARRWVRELGVEHPELIAHLPLRGYAMPLQTEQIVTWAVGWLLERAVKVWVIDPFAEAFDGDENDNSEVRVWLQNVNEIKRRAEVEDVFLIVHTGHADQEEGRERARGASRLEGWKDVGWYYTKHPDSDGLRFLRAFGRDVDQPNFAVRYDPVTRLLSRDEHTAGMSRGEVVANTKAKRVSALVAQNPGITKTALRQRLGRGGNVEKDSWVQTAVDLGLIRTEDGKQRSVLHFPAEQPKFQIGEVAES